MADIAEMRGVPQLQERTLGDPRITIALLDGAADPDHACFAGARVRLVDPSGLLGHEVEPWTADHATHVASVLFGQPGSEVPGLAPDCSGLVVVTGTSEATLTDPVLLARAVEYAVDAGVDVIHCAVCVPSRTGTDGGRLLAHAFEAARAAGIPVVAPAGNDSGTSWCLPATSPATLAVGSVDDHGVPAASTNHGDRYTGHAVMANGTRILGAVPGGGTIRMRGTSCAAPIATGVLALLLSDTRDLPEPPTAFDAARAIVASARPYEGPAEDAERCIGGILDPLAALDMLRDNAVPSPAGRNTVSILRPQDVDELRGAVGDPDAGLPPRSPIRWQPGHVAHVEAMADDEGVPSGSAAGASQSVRLPARVFVLGQIDVDFGSSARRDQLARVLAAEGIAAPPEDPETLVALLRRHPAEAAGLVWILTQDGAPVYALAPEGPFEADIWSTLVEAYEALHAGGTPPPVQRVSLPGVRVARSRTTASGTELPVLVLPALRGIYAWATDDLASSATAGLDGGVDLSDEVAQLLDRGYFETANTGDTAPSRALNYCLTNAVAVTWSLARIRGTGRVLESLSVRRSRFARPRSDCWDLVLAFHDVEDDGRARALHRHTVDVADIVPVSVGTPEEWLEPAPIR